MPVQAAPLQTGCWTAWTFPGGRVARVCIPAEPPTGTLHLHTYLQAGSANRRHEAAVRSSGPTFSLRTFPTLRTCFLLLLKAVTRPTNGLDTDDLVPSRKRRKNKPTTALRLERPVGCLRLPPALASSGLLGRWVQGPVWFLLKHKQRLHVPMRFADPGRGGCTCTSQHG